MKRVRSCPSYRIRCGSDTDVHLRLACDIPPDKGTENRIMDSGNLLLVGDNLYRLSKQERANANAFDINDFLEP